MARGPKSAREMLAKQACRRRSQLLAVCIGGVAGGYGSGVADRGIDLLLLAVALRIIAILWGQQTRDRALMGAPQGVRESARPTARI